MEGVKEIFRNKKSAFYTVTLVIIGLFGAFLRINAYLMNPSMWCDEVSLALNVDKNVFLPPLLNNQSAPFLFLILAKICSLFSWSNFSFRFIPFISGLISIPVFYIFAKNWIKSRLGLILAFFIFCINFRLIYFSREFKPYATDVLIFMLAIICYFKIDFSKINLKTCVLSGTAYALLPLLSFPSLFVLPVCYLFTFFQDGIKNFKKNIKTGVCFMAAGIIFLPVYYFTVLLKYSTNEYLLDFWRKGFVTFKTILPAFLDVLDFFQEPSFANLFLIAAVITGFVICLKQNKRTCLFLICVLAFIILASFLHKYPIRERLVLFLYPVFLVFVFKIFDIKMFKARIKNILFAVILFILAFGFDIKTTLNADFDEKLYCMEAINGLLNVLKHEHKSGEYIFPLPWSDVAFLHYNKTYKFPEKDIVIFKENHSKDYTKPFWGIPKGKYWLIFTIRPDNYYRHVSLQEWLERDFKVIKIYQDHSSRMYYAEKIR